MGLFDKKICNICGEKIGLLGNRKLDDGNLCKDCAKKLSPWFEERRHSTVEDIKRQLEYREKNKKAVMDFCITRQINTRNYNVFIDDNKGNFTVARKLDVNENPDIVPLSAIVQCRVDVDQQQQEETYTKDGETVSYQPPVYKYEFDYTMRIKVRTQWFDDMDFRLNTFSISSDNRRELMEDYCGTDTKCSRDAARDARNEYERRDAVWDAGNEHERRNAARNVRNEHERRNAADGNVRNEHDRRNATE